MFSMTRSLLLTVALAVALIILLPANVFARTHTLDRVQFGSNIYVDSTDATGDLVCIACSIHVRGKTAGDAVAIAGSIVLESGEVDGDAVAIGGQLKLRGASHVGGDAVSLIGGVLRDSDATVGGEMVSLGGPLWFLLIVVAPCVLLAAFIALIVWLFQKLRQPAQPYPGAVPTPRV
jgi:hypothetical protein